MAKNVQKSVMHVQSCCFTTKNSLLFVPLSLPSLSLLPKLLFSVIQKFLYHGNEILRGKMSVALNQAL